jgi:NTP pyrophosphatase (non-canonical NTP hydrolase)
MILRSFFLWIIMDIKELTQAMHHFVESKGWYAAGSRRPQTPRNIAISLSLEAAEVLEHFQWDEGIRDRKALANELADVTLYLLQLASVAEIDLEQAVLEKLRQNHDRSWDSNVDKPGQTDPNK